MSEDNDRCFSTLVLGLGLGYSRSSTSKLLFYSVVLSCSTLLPTVLTLFIMAGISRFTVRQLPMITEDDLELSKDGDQLDNTGDEEDISQKQRALEFSQQHPAHRNHVDVFAFRRYG